MPGGRPVQAVSHGHCYTIHPFHASRFAEPALHDINVLDILLVEARIFYIMDRDYLDFVRLYAMHRAGAFFVTRAKENQYGGPQV